MKTITLLESLFKGEGINELAMNTKISYHIDYPFNRKFLTSKVAQFFNDSALVEKFG
ncbi:MAG: hypothetical protein AB8H03_19480 [Saprospiraceae bacterium]